MLSEIEDKLESVEIQIVGQPGRKMGNVVGQIRFVHPNLGIVGEYPFQCPLELLCKMNKSEFEVYAKGQLRVTLERDLIERRWVKVQNLLKDYVVIEDAEL